METLVLSKWVHVFLISFSFVQCLLEGKWNKPMGMGPMVDGQIRALWTSATWCDSNSRMASNWDSESQQAFVSRSNKFAGWPHLVVSCWEFQWLSHRWSIVGIPSRRSSSTDTHVWTVPVLTFGLWADHGVQLLHLTQVRIALPIITRLPWLAESSLDHDPHAFHIHGVMGVLNPIIATVRAP